MTDTDERFSAEVGEMNMLGNGIVRRDGCVVFCLGACDGDTVSATITEKKKNFQIARVDSIDSPSPYRTEPDCPAFPACGGCTLRHITYEHEAKIKKAGVESALRRAGLGSLTVDEIITASPERYRNKAVFRFDSEGKASFSEGKSNTLVPIGDCLICPEGFSEIARFCGEFFREVIDRITYLFIRSNRDGSEISVMLGTKPDADIGAEDFADALTEKFPAVTSVFLKKSQHPEEIGIPAEHIRGAKLINERFLALSLVISPLSFFQVNYAAAEKLCRKVCEYVPENAFGADLYCGTGIIAMSVAKNVKGTQVTGVEINPSAVEDAKQNAALNSLHNVGFFCGDSADFAKSIYGSLDFITIDPPRSGCSDKMIKELLHIRAKRIIYVSCDPATLARDLKKLTEKYRITALTACDLFPRTAHMETVAALTLK